MLTTMPISPGDLVLLGSDGLWDNVSEDELLDEVERDIVEGGGPQGVLAPQTACLFCACVRAYLRACCRMRQRRSLGEVGGRKVCTTSCALACWLAAGLWPGCLAACLLVSCLSTGACLCSGRRICGR